MWWKGSNAILEDKRLSWALGKNTFQKVYIDLYIIEGRPYHTYAYYNFDWFKEDTISKLKIQEIWSEASSLTTRGKMTNEK